MTDFLRLPHLRTLDVADCGEHYKVHAEGAAVPTACPACQSPLTPSWAGCCWQASATRLPKRGPVADG